MSGQGLALGAVAALAAAAAFGRGSGSRARGVRGDSVIYVDFERRSLAESCTVGRIDGVAARGHPEESQYGTSFGLILKALEWREWDDKGVPRFSGGNLTLYAIRFEDGEFNISDCGPDPDGWTFFEWDEDVARDWFSGGNGCRVVAISMQVLDVFDAENPSVEDMATVIELLPSLLQLLRCP